MTQESRDSLYCPWRCSGSMIWLHECSDLVSTWTPLPHTCSAFARLACCRVAGDRHQGDLRARAQQGVSGSGRVGVREDGGRSREAVGELVCVPYVCASARLISKVVRSGRHHII